MRAHVITLVTLANLLPAFAQRAAAQDLSQKLKSQDEVTVTLRDGSVQQGLVESVSTSALTMTSFGKPRTFDLSSVETIRKQGDSILNGTIIGIVAGAGAGLALESFVVAYCNNENGINCPSLKRSAWSVPIAIGTVLGAAIDSSRVGSTVVFSSRNQVGVSPIVGPGTIGVQARISLR